MSPDEGGLGKLGGTKTSDAFESFLNSTDVTIISTVDSTNYVNVGLTLRAIAHGRVILESGESPREGDSVTTVTCGFFPAQRLPPQELWRKLGDDITPRGSVLILLGVPPPSPSDVTVDLPQDVTAVYLPDAAQAPTREQRQVLLDHGISIFPPRPKFECFLSRGSRGNSPWVRASQNILAAEGTGHAKTVPFPDDATLSLGILHRLASSAESVELVITSIAKGDVQGFVSEGLLAMGEFSANKHRFLRKTPSVATALGSARSVYPRLSERAKTGTLARYLVPDLPWSNAAFSPHGGGFGAPG